jgi:hypothetical protein
MLRKVNLMLFLIMWVKNLMMILLDYSIIYLYYSLICLCMLYFKLNQCMIFYCIHSLLLPFFYFCWWLCNFLMMCCCLLLWLQLWCHLWLLLWLQIWCNMNLSLLLQLWCKLCLILLNFLNYVFFSLYLFPYFYGYRCIFLRTNLL